MLLRGCRQEPCVEGPAAHPHLQGESVAGEPEPFHGLSEETLLVVHEAVPDLYTQCVIISGSNVK